MEVAAVYLDILGQRIKEILKKFQSSKEEEEEEFEDDDELVIQDSTGDIIDIIPPKKRRVETVVKKLIIIATILMANASYIMVGGFLFTSTETEYQETARENVKQFQQQYCHRFEPLYRYQGLSFRQILEDSINNYTKGIYKFLDDQHWDGQPVGKPVEQWQFDAAVLYSIVVITSIGYGDVTPKSRNGRLLTVIYAMLGIPIFLMFINIMGQKLGKGFKYLYYHVTCIPKKERKKSEVEAARAASLGEEAPEKKELTRDEEKNQKSRQMRELLIPIHVSTMVLLFYLFIGCIFFTVFEGTWDFFESLYFSFISLTTIGFGDYVFGKCRSGRGCANSAWKIGISCIYILLGLGVVSMAFNQMAQTFTMQFRDIGVKLGILKAKDNEEAARKKRDLEELGLRYDIQIDKDDEKILFKF